MRVTVHRKAHFNAAHRLYNSAWDDEKNFKTFGKCSYPNYHGHNYEMIVSVTGEIDPVTGFVINLDVLKRIIYEEIEVYFDHKNLNLDLIEFKDKIPTAENIVVLIWNRIRYRLDDHIDLKITLYETPRNFVTYDGN
ncbi:MAG: 6-carboxytetrahydropterin synthase [Flavobacteriaceae bacterium]|nr:6-carboxytetrahydropterin synthase [Flavobacteriaceae bacterium]